MNNSQSRIFVDAHHGMGGSKVEFRLNAGGYVNFLARDRNEIKLLDRRVVHAFLGEHRTDDIIIAAVKFVGILANNRYRADFIYQDGPGNRHSFVLLVCTVPFSQRQVRTFLNP